MPARRILCLWFPRLGAERILRLERGRAAGPLATVTDTGNMQVLASLTSEASQAGLAPGQPLRDARAMCPGLITRPASPVAEAAFLTRLRRWAGKFSPWIGEQPPDALVADITGCAHLFGGEEALAARAQEDCAGLGLTLALGLADTLGAAWALARFAGATVAGGAGGDAIDAEARATRSRAARSPVLAMPTMASGTVPNRQRHRTRGGPAPAVAIGQVPSLRIAAPGQTRAALEPLPVAALRLSDGDLAALSRLGIRRIGDLVGMPRAGLARRFGRNLVQRLDQALGAEPEPISPARAPLHFAVRMALPEPIGLEADLLAGLDRLLPVFAQRLRARGRGARQVQLELSRTDGSLQVIRAGLARASADPDRIRPLIAMQLGEVEAGFGIDLIRLVATRHEAVAPVQHRGPILERGGAGQGRQAAALDDLMGRIGARLGLDALTRLHPAESHIPEKAALTLAAAWSEPARNWQPPPGLARPLLLWPPEPVHAPASPALPPRFRWRGQDHQVTGAQGPERIAPEWWLAEDAWRSGPRDYWQVVTARGARLWLYFAHGAELSPGWFCHGAFA